MKNLIKASVLLLVTITGGWAYGATLYLDELPPTAGARNFRITRIAATSQEHSRSLEIESTWTRLTFWSPNATWCGAGAWEVNCLGGVKPGNPNKCTGQQGAFLELQKYVGLGIVTEGSGTPTTWQHDCGVYGSGGWVLRGSMVINPVQVSCTSTTAQMTLEGRLGSSPTNTANVYIHCDSSASLRLSLANSGVLKVGDVGEVQLKFPRTGNAVLYVSGTDPVVSVNGELTKSPTTAGTYRGSTVLRIDVL